MSKISVTSKEDIVSEILSERIEKYVLSNGLTVFFCNKNDFNSTYALFSANYGSIDREFKTEREKDFTIVPDGIAHFLEHKLFENEDGSDAFAKFNRFQGSSPAHK